MKSQLEKKEKLKRVVYGPLWLPDSDGCINPKSGLYLLAAPFYQFIQKFKNTFWCL